MHPKVFLVGFMGSGKTTVGKVLAERLDFGFLDLDAVIEEHSGMPIAEIFRRHGEAGFRETENRLLQSLAEPPALVVALGGGAFCAEPNRQLVRSAGVSVWLDVPLETAWERCRSDSTRPLAGDREYFEALYRRRSADYALADLRVDAQGKTSGQIAAEIERWLNQLKGADHGMDSNH